MRNYLKIPKPLFTPSLSPPPQQPQPQPPHKPTSPMLYYSIVVVATATIVLAIYHLVIIRLCTIRYHRHLQQQQQQQRQQRQQGQFSRPRTNPDPPNTTIRTPCRSLSSVHDNACYISSFKYKNQADRDMECSVCLSVFEEGDEVKRLPICDHCFHASCIDMWLYGHVHCPLCRASVVAPPPPPPPPPSPGSSSV